MPHFLKTIHLSILIFAPILVSANPGQTRIFWTDKDTRRIESSNLDGSDRITLLNERSDPRGIAVDLVNNTLYWASHEINGAIYSANCDGSNVQTVLSGLNQPADIALDPQNRLLYWAEEGTNEIRRISLDADGSPETILTNLNRPYYLSIQPTSGFIYWSDFNSGTIHRATIDGQNPQSFITGQERIRDIEIAEGYLYWCDRNSNQIRRRLLNGAGTGTILFSGAADSLDRPHGLVLDPSSNTMFWTDTATAEINSAAMDGTGSVTTLISTELDGAWAIDIAKPITANSYQTWLELNFTAEELSNPDNQNNVWGENADPDLDGRVNLLEYVQATRPKTQDSDSSSIQTKMLLIEDQWLMTITFRMPKGDPSLTFAIESTANLDINTWRTGQYTESPERLDDPENPGYEFITTTSPIEGQGFARLRVSR